MEVDKDSICRLCLSITSCDECQKLDSISQDILNVVAPEVDLNITNDPKICQSCYKTMLRCYRFKTTCGKGGDNPEVKKTSEVDTDTEELVKQCSFCSTNIDEEWLGKFETHRFYFKIVLQKCLPDWTSTSPETVPCKSCLEVLTFHFAFIGNCSDTESKLKNIISSQEGGTSSINLYEVLRFIPKKESNNADINEYNNALQEKASHDLPFPEVAIKNESIETEAVDIKTGILDGELIENTVCYNSDVQGKDVRLAELPSGSGTKTNEVHKKRANVNDKASGPAKKTRTVEQRSVGVQVNPKDLIETCSVGVQVNLMHLVLAVAPSEEEVTSTTSSTRRKQKFKPRILRRQVTKSRSSST